MNTKSLSIGIDLVFCLVVLPVIITLVPVEKWIEKYTLFAMALLLFLYVMYFVIRRVNFVRLIRRKKYFHVAAMALASAGVAWLLSRIPYPDETNYIMSDRLRAHLRAQTVWLLFLVVVGFSLSINLMLELFRQAIEKKEIEVQKNRAELALYKSQIRPHFMFNTLNTLYGLVVGKSDRAEEAFMKFADMVQYLYLHAKDEKTCLRDEVEYINHYIDLQTLRLNSHTMVLRSCEIDDYDVRIPPMILMTFVENAFKYGSSPSRDSTIEICIRQRDGVLVFNVVNDILRHQESGDSAPGIGIENCRSRLNLQYPEKYSLKTSEVDGRYKVELRIMTEEKES